MNNLGRLEIYYNRRPSSIRLLDLWRVFAHCKRCRPWTLQLQGMFSFLEVHLNCEWMNEWICGHPIVYHSSFSFSLLVLDRFSSKTTCIYNIGGGSDFLSDVFEKLQYLSIRFCFVWISLCCFYFLKMIVDLVEIAGCFSRLIFFNGCSWKSNQKYPVRQSQSKSSWVEIFLCVRYLGYSFLSQNSEELFYRFSNFILWTKKEKLNFNSIYIYIYIVCVCLVLLKKSVFFFYSVYIYYYLCVLLYFLVLFMNFIALF